MTQTNGSIRTPAQLAASRQNGAKSRGPRTAAGKLRSRLNSLRHGHYAQSLRPWLVAPGARAAFEAKLEALRADYRPTGPVANELVQQLADDWVRFAELKRCEAGIVAGEDDASEESRATVSDEAAVLSELLVAVQQLADSGEHPFLTDVDVLELLDQTWCELLHADATRNWLADAAAPLERARARLAELEQGDAVLQRVASGEILLTDEAKPAWAEAMLELEAALAARVRHLEKEIRKQQRDADGKRLERIDGLDALHRQQAMTWRRIQQQILQLENYRKQSQTAAGPQGHWH